MTQTEGLPILLAWILFLAWVGILAAIVLHRREDHPDTDRSAQTRAPAADTRDGPTEPNRQG